MLDPNTGAGAYLIDGGLNGGADPDCDDHPSPLVQAVVAIVLTALLVIIIAAVLPEAIAIIAAAGRAAVKSLRPILTVLTAGSGLLLSSQAQANYNKNQCCENAKQEAATAYGLLRQRLDEWYIDNLGLHDSGHLNAIKEASDRLKKALEKITSNCGKKAYPAEFDDWTATVIEAEAVINYS
ncbi:hypothetical protein [Methylovulum miyakonense]|uniref:hypothetical protein n=1 Tax=Methylovulum miyakonense TaxID=645578 RepID=UPI00036DC067|nr:hypothetical protein [Methylovulum miyakonense]